MHGNECHVLQIRTAVPVALGLLQSAKGVKLHRDHSTDIWRAYVTLTFGIRLIRNQMPVQFLPIVDLMPRPASQPIWISVSDVRGRN